MKLSFSQFTAVAVGLWLLGLSQTAHAQLNNQPFAFQRGGMSAGSVGMSPAYREIILERKLLGRSTANNFIRGIDGSLVNVERTGDQAFARPVAAPYAASQSRFSLGSGGSAAAGLNQSRLMSQSASANEDMPALSGAAAGAVPINSWIYQLETLPELAL